MTTTRTWVVANGRRVRLLGLPGGVGDASGCSTAPDSAGGTASAL